MVSKVKFKSKWISAQRVISGIGKKGGKVHATGNQKETGKEARESAHRQGQLQYLRLVRSPTEGRVKRTLPLIYSGGEYGM